MLTDSELYDFEFSDDDDEIVLDCGIPGCIMLGEHFRSECHTAEELEAYYEELKQE